MHNHPLVLLIEYDFPYDTVMNIVKGNQNYPISAISNGFMSSH
ncbi:hypothetical protein ACMXYX_08385 [Neptuniibacter sp. QD72_48]